MHYNDSNCNYLYRLVSSHRYWLPKSWIRRSHHWQSHHNLHFPARIPLTHDCLAYWRSFCTFWLHSSCHLCSLDCSFSHFYSNFSAAADLCCFVVPNVSFNQSSTPYQCVSSTLSDSQAGSSVPEQSHPYLLFCCLCQLLSSLYWNAL